MTDSKVEEAVNPPLDLTVPFKNSDSNGQPVIDNGDSNQTVIDGLFAIKPKTTTSPFELKGGWINSAEPEAEKRKSIDGASITIDIKQ